MLTFPLRSPDASLADESCTRLMKILMAQSRINVKLSRTYFATPKTQNPSMLAQIYASGGDIRLKRLERAISRMVAEASDIFGSKH